VTIYAFNRVSTEGGKDKYMDPYVAS